MFLSDITILSQLNWNISTKILDIFLVIQYDKFQTLYFFYVSCISEFKYIIRTGFSPRSLTSSVEFMSSNYQLWRHLRLFTALNDSVFHCPGIQNSSTCISFKALGEPEMYLLPESIVNLRENFLAPLGRNLVLLELQ